MIEYAKNKKVFILIFFELKSDFFFVTHTQVYIFKWVYYIVYKSSRHIYIYKNVQCLLSSWFILQKKACVLCSNILYICILFLFLFFAQAQQRFTVLANCEYKLLIIVIQTLRNIHNSCCCWNKKNKKKEKKTSQQSSYKHLFHSPFMYITYTLYICIMLCVTL